MGYAASGPTGDGWYVRVTDYRAGTYAYLGPFMSRQGMRETAAYLKAHAWHRPADYNVQEYTHHGGAEAIPGLTNPAPSSADHPALDPERLAGWRKNPLPLDQTSQAVVDDWRKHPISGEVYVHTTEREDE